MGVMTGAPVRIRRCREADLPLLEWFGAFTHHRQIIRDAYRLQKQHDVVMLVADCEHFPVGQVWLDLRQRRGHVAPSVWALRVYEPVQRRGVGTLLMQALERVARERGKPLLELSVEKHNDPARRLYERLGWRLIGQRAGNYAYHTPAGLREVVSLDEWVFVKQLEPSRPTRRRSSGTCAFQCSMRTSVAGRS
jgi:ribosomal protein S18 acetylase RimI-like enzyme